MTAGIVPSKQRRDRRQRDGHRRRLDPAPRAGPGRLVEQLVDLEHERHHVDGEDVGRARADRCPPAALARQNASTWRCTRAMSPAVRSSHADDDAALELDRPVVRDVGDEQRPPAHRPWRWLGPLGRRCRSARGRAARRARRGRTPGSRRAPAAGPTDAEDRRDRPAEELDQSSVDQIGRRRTHRPEHSSPPLSEP